MPVHAQRARAVRRHEVIQMSLLDYGSPPPLPRNTRLVHFNDRIKAPPVVLRLTKKGAVIKRPEPTLVDQLVLFKDYLGLKLIEE